MPLFTTSLRQSKRPEWKQNLLVLWFGTFMAGIGSSCVAPFIALFIDQLGSFSNSENAFWSGLAFSAPFLTKAVISPFWGHLSDRYGRKPMLIRASLGMALVMAATALVGNVYELIGLRLLLGVFNGFVSTANALIAIQVPRNQSGQSLGTLATGNVSGTLIGPLVGGTIADFVGYRYTFFMTGICLFISFLLVVFFVHEHFTPVIQRKDQPSANFFKVLPNRRIILGMFLTTMIIQASNNSIEPILSLYVRQLMNGAGHVALAAGVIEAINGIATLFAAPFFGRLGDRWGTHWILLSGLIFSMLVFIPMAFVQNIWELGALRLLIGVSDAALIPGVQTILAKNSPHKMMGEVFSWNQSFQAVGNVVGPQIGSSVTEFAGYRGVFLSTSLLVLINFLAVFKNTKSLHQRSKK
ncbi:multidrug efflux MFS transporter [Oenococcus oeni]|uniref:multidrug efflux MFS transporter n=1 Tax=Oenococcus oeni TaxID=1247 RepID=UPI000277B256|nr:multidrug efflux MFS transporter [Oenococcus oeni]EJN99354.1 major facilitator superfamily permease [Oenococcus oeni AWRIB418]OIM42402.1 multidrug transporter subunit MdtG [Oenococcus oeni]QGR00743.1 MFS transporter [Oenococcus oeni]TEU22417.1 MFS transporter [Oenococcus oeni]TEU53138.1 MFS transporter [Oenococcus oeni]